MAPENRDTPRGTVPAVRSPLASGQERPVSAALAARGAALEAERLAPVPRASHAVDVDVDDLALLTAFVASVIAAAAQAGRGRDVVMSGDASTAWHRLDAAVRCHAGAAA